MFILRKILFLPDFFLLSIRLQECASEAREREHKILEMRRFSLLFIFSVYIFSSFRTVFRGRLFYVYNLYFENRVLTKRV